VPIGPEPGHRGVHVMPLNDYRDHEPSTECWCHPQEDEEIPGLFVHRSMDGREAFESGERLLS
jgi:hypothetical protein